MMCLRLVWCVLLVGCSDWDSLSSSYGRRDGAVGVGADASVDASADATATHADASPDAVVVDAGCGGFGQPCCGGISCTIVLQCQMGTCTFAPLAPMPTPRTGAGIAVDNDVIYVIGGWNGDYLSTVEAYAPLSSTWTTRVSMPTARAALGAARGADGRIYAMGGETPSMGRITTVEAYDPRTDAWSSSASMPTPRAGLAVVAGPSVAGTGLIYAIGGGDDNDFLDAVEAWEPRLAMWFPRTNMPTNRGRLAGTLGADGQVYAIGGYHVVNSNNSAYDVVESYNPGMDTWSRRADMPSSRWSLAVVAAAGRIYALGGKHQNSDPTAAVEAYDPATDLWMQKSDMPTARRGLAAVVGADGRIYAIGGQDANDRPLATVEAYDPLTDVWYR